VIDTGDTVKHCPTGEKWLVAYVKDDKLAWCGWPEGEANLCDCELIEVATSDDRYKLLKEMAKGNGTRSAYAQSRLNEFY
jgi:hypothetical protein